MKALPAILACLSLLALGAISCSTNPVWGLVDESFYTGEQSPEERRAKQERTQALQALGLLAANPSDASADSPSSPTAVRSFKYIFATNTSYTGSLFGGGPGLSQIDAKCNSDAARPDPSVTYKALIVAATRRIACTSANCSTSGSLEHIDWVLAPSQEYRRSDGVTVIGTTQSNAGIFDLAIGLDNSFSGSNVSFWSGLLSDWTISSNTCTNGAAWNDASTGVSGQIGDLSVKGSAAISNGASGCDQMRPLLCVEQ